MLLNIDDDAVADSLSNVNAELIWWKGKPIPRGNTDGDGTDDPQRDLIMLLMPFEKVVVVTWTKYTTRGQDLRQYIDSPWNG